MVFQSTNMGSGCDETEFSSFVSTTKTDHGAEERSNDASDRHSRRSSRYFDADLEEPPNVAENPSEGHPKLTYTIRIRNLCYVTAQPKHVYLYRSGGRGQKSEGHCILKNVSFDAKPGELLALVGPSGAGKSTLLEILAGRIKPGRSETSILVNDAPVNRSKFGRTCGYITQEDVLFPLLTVSEILTFSSCFRLPSTVSRREKEAKVKALVAELGLEHVANSRIGDERRRGISGGERRRVSIGVDVIHDPAVLLLDEPTTALDSAAALHVVEMLHAMTVARKRTIILSIHQPSYRILRLISSILFIVKGTVVHHGSMGSLEEALSSAGHETPAQLNAVEYAMEILAGSDDDPEFLRTGRTPVTAKPRGFFSADGNALTEFADREYCKGEDRIGFANSRFAEICILSCRFGKIMYRTKELFATRIFQALVGAAGLGTVYLNVGYDERGLEGRLGFFAFTVTFLLASTMEALPIFVQERRIFVRETSRGAYRVSSYVVSNTLVFLPFLLLVALLYAVPVYWLVGLSSKGSAFLCFVLVVWLILIMAYSFIAFLSALVPDFIVGSSLFESSLQSFFLFSGYFISKNSIPKFWLLMYYISLYRYPLDALLINEYSSQENKCFGWKGGLCVLRGRDVLKQRGVDDDRLWTNVGIMIGFIVFYRLLCFLVLKSRAAGTNPARS